MITITERTSCAGCDVTVKGAASKKIGKLFKDCKGKVGCITDKSVDLEFATQEQADTFMRDASALGVIFD